MRGVLLLANYTGWSRAEILDMQTEELAEWITRIPKRST
jgi:hypothetical protein